MLWTEDQNLVNRSPIRWWKHYWTYLLLVILCMAFLFPIIYALVTSLQPTGFGLAQNLFRDGVYWGHYEQLLSTPRYVRNLLNSAITSLGGALLTTTFCALAGYAFARLRFQGRRGVLILLLGLMMLPGIVNLIPLYRLTSELLRLVPTGAAIIGDLNARQVANLLLLIAVYSAFGIPFGVWVMKSFYAAIPRELEDAALVDGATPLQALRHVLLPLSLPGLMAVFLTNFVFNWNDFVTASLLIRSDELKTATVGLLDFQNQLTGNNSELLNAAAIMMMLPGIGLFLLARKAFFQGFIEGAFKG